MSCSRWSSIVEGVQDTLRLDRACETRSAGGSRARTASTRAAHRHLRAARTVGHPLVIVARGHAAGRSRGLPAGRAHVGGHAVGRRCEVAVTVSSAAQTQRRHGNSGEHPDFDGRAACSALAVDAGLHPEQCQLDVGQRPPGAGRHDRLDLADGLVGGRAVHAVRVGRRCPATSLRRVVWGELLDPEIALVLQGALQLGQQRGEQVEPVSRGDPATGLSHRELHVGGECGARLRAGGGVCAARTGALPGLRRRGVGAGCHLCADGPAVMCGAAAASSGRGPRAPA